MALLWKHEHVKALSGTDESLDYTHCITRVDIVVDVSVYEKKMSLEILRDFRIGCDLVYEGGVSLLGNLLLDSMMGLAPPTVVDVVVVVSCT